MSLKQKLLKTVAIGTTLAALSGMPAYASYNNTKSGFDGAKFTFGDIDRDGLTDMIVANNSAVTYFRGKGNGAFEYKQRIYTLKDKEKPSVTLTIINGQLELIIFTKSEFKVFKVNEYGRFEESEFELEWMDDTEEEELMPVKDIV